MLAAPAQAETWSCSSHDGKTAVFIRNGEGFDRPFEIYGKERTFRFDIVQESEHLIKLLNSNPKTVNFVALYKKQKRFEIFGGSDDESPSIPPSPSIYWTGGCVVH